MPFLRFSSVYAGALAALLSAGSLAAASAHSAAETTLRLGMSYVPPAYQAGSKFRTPEAVDLALAHELARRMRAPLKPLRADLQVGSRLLATGKLDVLISSESGTDSGNIAIATGYAAKPMAIMRTDTTIKTPEHLRGRKVCVAEGGPYVGMIASRYGAIETVAKAPADSLLAVRTGACDAAVHDSALLEELIKLPEWKKFSASLYLGPAVEQSIIVRRDNPSALHVAKKAADEWRRTDFIGQEIKRMVRHIAFEVYLDQNVPDCH